jgi:hypothetical protein
MIITVSLIHKLYESLQHTLNLLSLSSVTAARLWLPTIVIPQLPCSRPYWLVTVLHLTHCSKCRLPRHNYYWLTAKLLLGLASIMILGSESHGIQDHILLSDRSGSLQSLSPDYYWLAGSHYTALVLTTQKTLLPTILPFLCAYQLRWKCVYPATASQRTMKSCHNMFLICQEPMLLQPSNFKFYITDWPNIWCELESSI